MLSLSRNMPKNCGLSAMTTTAFWTVDRVTSAGRLISCDESNCRVQEMPNSDVAGSLPMEGFSSVKYEKSSSDLVGVSQPERQEQVWGPATRLTRAPHHSTP